MNDDDTLKTRRCDITRANILAAARERFAAEGYERATIRAIAADAGIDPALVMRYYGNKAGLFAAAADFDLQLPELAAVPRDNVASFLMAICWIWKMEPFLWRNELISFAQFEAAESISTNSIAPPGK